MRKLVLLAVVFVLAGAACANDDLASPTAVPATSNAPTEGAAVDPGNVTTTTTMPATTSSSTGSAQGTPSSTTLLPLVPLDQLELDLEVVADGFVQPVFVSSPPGDDRLFVLDQPGVVWVMASGDPEVYLDLRDRVGFGGERGLLGLAFSPDFADSGLLYLDYTARDGSTRIAEYRESDAGSERVMLEIAQPAANHNGGMLAFGPDGYLWIAMGDGGSRDDEFGNGQDPGSLLGTLLRIDVAGDPYAIPADNPSGEFAPEVWAFGLRNPWRFSFDGSDLWIGDVGQGTWEEIDRVDVTQVTGPNFGWPRYEGSHCYLAQDCDSTDLVGPVYEYSHDEGRSVTGGYVYRGSALPELDGHYFFGDFVGGWIRGLTPGGEIIEWFGPGSVPGLSSFGVDAAGEIYVTSTEGALYRVVRG